MNKEEIENKIKGICQDCMWLEKIEPIINQLQKENQELKNSINALQKELNEENLQCSKYAIENQELKKIVELCSKSLYNVELTKYKEVIDKAIEYINKMFETGFYNDDYYLGKLKKILSYKEVSE